MRSRKRANLREVALKAGVSIATASRVINKSGSVSEKARVKVNAAIEELKFVPSAAAKAINSGRTRTVGALVPTLDNAIFARFLRSLENEFANSGLSLVVSSTNNDPELELERAKKLVQIGVEGLLISGTDHNQEFHELIEKVQLPTVATSFYDPDYHLPTIGYDNKQVSQKALRYLVGLRHKQIGVIHGPTANNDRTRTRLAGLNELAEDVVFVFAETEMTVEGGCEAVKMILHNENRPSALISLSDVQAIGAISELKRQKLLVPGDMSIVSVDNLPASQFLEPALTTVNLPVAEMGEYAARAISGWIENNERPESILLPAEIMIRESAVALHQ
ncbi:MAG: LacI family DNA-binding transcriptional regulator [Pseudomonadota bacterium]